jgi:hypothetical protein
MGNCVSRSKQPFPVPRSSSAENNMGSGIPDDGLPIAEPTTSFWTIPATPIAKPQPQENLPSHADVGEYALYLFGGHQVNN